MRGPPQEVIKEYEILKSGTLKKLGGGDGGHKNWKDRYFVLRNHLAYYKDWESSEKKGEPLGVIALNSYFAAPVEGSTNFEFAVHAYPKSLVCRASSKADMDEWMDALNTMVLPEDEQVRVVRPGAAVASAHASWRSLDPLQGGGSGGPGDAARWGGSGGGGGGGGRGCVCPLRCRARTRTFVWPCNKKERRSAHTCTRAFPVCAVFFWRSALEGLGAARFADLGRPRAHPRRRIPMHGWPVAARAHAVAWVFELKGFAVPGLS